MKIKNIFVLLTLFSFFEHGFTKSAAKVDQSIQNSFKLLYAPLLHLNLIEFYENLLRLAKELKPEELQLLLNKKLQDGSTLVHKLISIKTETNQDLKNQKILCLQALFNDGANFFLENNQGVSAMDLLRSDVDEEVAKIRFWVVEQIMFNDRDESYFNNTVTELGVTGLIIAINKATECSQIGHNLFLPFENSLKSDVDVKALTLRHRLLFFITYYRSFIRSLISLSQDLKGDVSPLKNALHKMFELRLESPFDFEPIIFDMNYMLTSNFVYLPELRPLSLLSLTLLSSLAIDDKIDLLKEMLHESFHINLNKQSSAEQDPAIFDVLYDYKAKKISLDDAIRLWQEFFKAGADVNIIQKSAETQQNDSVFSIIIKSKDFSTIDKQILIKFFLDNKVDLKQETFLIINNAQSLKKYIADPLLLIAVGILSAAELDIILSHPEFARQGCTINTLYQTKSVTSRDMKSVFVTMLMYSVLNDHESRVMKTLIKHGADVNQASMNDDLPICHCASMLAVGVPPKECLHLLDCIQDLISDPNLKLLKLVDTHYDKKTIPMFVKDCFDSCEKNYSLEIQEKFKMVFNQLIEKYNAQKREQAKVEFEIQQKKVVLLQAKKAEESRVRAEQLAFQREKGQAAALEKSEIAKKQRLQALEENFKVREQNSRKKYEEQQVLLTKQLENMQEQKAQLEGLSSPSSKARLTTTSTFQSWYDILKAGNLNDFERNKVNIYLKKFSLNFSVPVSIKYQLNVKEIANKKNVFIDMHHILSAYIQLDQDDNLDIKGAHFYDTIQKILVSPLIEKFEKLVDPATNCVYFKLFPIGKNSKPIIKTTFPEDWTIDTIYQVLTNSEFISESQEADLWIVTAQTQKDSKLKIKLVFRAEGLFYKLITAIPLIDKSLSSAQEVSAVASSKKIKR